MIWLIVYDDIGAFLSDSEIDIAVIATPNHVHKKYAVAAMRAGKHVICEKPVTMNAAEMQEIPDVRNETGKQFATNQNRRWDGGFRKLKTFVESGLITLSSARNQVSATHLKASPRSPRIFSATVRQ